MTESVPTRGSLRWLSPEAAQAMAQVARFIDTSMQDNAIEAMTGKAG
jgi:hypothetical protein